MVNFFEFFMSTRKMNAQDLTLALDSDNIETIITSHLDNDVMHNYDFVKNVVSKKSKPLNEWLSKRFEKSEYDLTFYLKEAVSKNEISTAKDLVMAGARVNGSGLIDYAAKKDDVELLMFIACHARNVDFSQQDASQKLPLGWAYTKGSFNAGRFLKDAGAKQQQFSDGNVGNYDLFIAFIASLKAEPIFASCLAQETYHPYLSLLSQMHIGDSSVASLNIEKMYNHLLELSKDDILGKILHTTSLVDAPIFIEKVKHNARDTTHGGCNLNGAVNIGIDDNGWSEGNSNTLIHELSHRLMIKLFNHVLAAPYAKEKDAFRAVIHQVLNNIFTYGIGIKKLDNLLELEKDYYSQSTYEKGQLARKLFKEVTESSSCYGEMCEFIVKHNIENTLDPLSTLAYYLKGSFYRSPKLDMVKLVLEQIPELNLKLFVFEDKYGLNGEMIKPETLQFVLENAKNKIDLNEKIAEKGYLEELNTMVFAAAIKKFFPNDNLYSLFIDLLENGGNILKEKGYENLYNIWKNIEKNQHVTDAEPLITFFLINSIRSDSFDKLKIAIKAGVNVNGSKILHYAAISGDDELVELIAQHSKTQVDFNDSSFAGYTPMQLAKLLGNVSTITVWEQAESAIKEKGLPLYYVESPALNIDVVKDVPEERLSQCGKDAISHFLYIYDFLGSYSEYTEHAEFVVRYPETIATGCYQQDEVLQKILAPLAKYWDEVIEPARQQYNEAHDHSQQCLAVNLFEAM
jgi:ankyrin repeat protein